MRQYLVNGSRVYLFWLLTLLLVAPGGASAQSDQAAQPTPATGQGQRVEALARVEPVTAAADLADRESTRPPKGGTAPGQQVPETAPAVETDKTAGAPSGSAGALQPIEVQLQQKTAASTEQPPALPKKAKSKTGEKKTDQTLDILGTQVAPGESRRLLWVSGETTYGSKLESPVYVIRGKHSGPTLCLTAAIHGDELNGVEIIRKLVSDLSPKKLYGTVIGVPIVNLLGFTRGTRYLPDRRDLNRYFPGNPNGSSASRIAHSFFEDIVRHCDLLIDLHTGSLTRTNMPQVRANLQIPEVLEFTTKFGSTAVLHSRKLRGNLRSAATNYGIPAVALELGEPGSLQQEHVEEGVEIIENVLSGLDMTRRLWTSGGSQPVFYSSRWVRVNTGGLLISEVEVGERIWEGAVLGSMVNPITNESFDVISPYSGRVLGMALNQFMLPGYAAFNIGIVSDEKEAVDDAENFECITTDMESGSTTDEYGCATEDDDDIVREEIDLGVEEGEEGS
ncbi:MAG: succinylglutamate desuccinylase/aspartoacylase family protein [Halioglobus sp.]|nr:succinylglutamate desuccinylase/aspartoacylase family protein [Halioglobus sp.]